MISPSREPTNSHPSWTVKLHWARWGCHSIGVIWESIVFGVHSCVGWSDVVGVFLSSLSSLYRKCHFLTSLNSPLASVRSQCVISCDLFDLFDLFECLQWNSRRVIINFSTHLSVEPCWYTLENKFSKVLEITNWGLGHRSGFLSDSDTTHSTNLASWLRIHLSDVYLTK